MRHESARGEITFETEVFLSDPSWLKDHRVFGRLVAPGALYGAMAASASLAEEGGSVVVEDMQLHNPLVFSEKESENGTGEEGRRVQVVLDDSGQTSSRRVQIYSVGAGREWTMHVEGRVSPGASLSEADARIDLEGLKARLSPADVPAYYRAKADTGIDLGPLFRTLGMCWSGPGEALGEVSLPEALGRNQLDVHPLLLDGCFQVVGVARNMTGGPDEATYLPFGWDRFWLSKRLPDRMFCHVSMSEVSQEAESSETPEVLSGEVRIYDPNGVLLGGLSGYTVKRATREALLSAVEGVDDLLYEVTWRDRILESALMPADFFPSPASVAARAQLFTGYLTDAGVDPQGRNALLADLERWSWARALATLEELGWQRAKGDSVDPEELRQRLGVLPEHSRLFRRMLEMVARSGVLDEAGDGFAVVVGPEDALPEILPRDLEEFAARMMDLYPDGLTEIGLFQRSGPRPRRCASRSTGPAYAAVQQRRAHGGRSVPEGTGGPCCKPDADRGDRGPGSRTARRTAAQGDRGGGRNGVGYRFRAPRASRGPVRLHVHGHLAGFFAEAEARFGGRRWDRSSTVRSTSRRIPLPRASTPTATTS